METFFQKQMEEKPDESPTLEHINSFDELHEKISDSIMRGIFSCGYEQPSTIQKLGILPILSGRDVIAQAQSGTGKTATFCIGGLARVDISVAATQVLILSPTRELSIQIASVAENIASFQKEIRIKTLMGGNSVQDDVNDLKSGSYQVAVGCPGRVTDLLQRKALDSFEIKTFILDEADEMLARGFQEQICKIFNYLSPDVQVVLFSATMPPETMEITKKFMRNPIVIKVKTENLSLDGIEQYFTTMENDTEKFDKLLILFRKSSIQQCIIYANSVERVKYLCRLLNENGFSVCEIHSDLNRGERERTLNQFKSGQMRTLVSTDVTARGIDVQQVNLVVNFDIPRDENVYLHRIGRSGRWGRTGTAINFVTRRDIYTMEKIEQVYNKKIKEYPWPEE